MSAVADICLPFAFASLDDQALLLLLPSSEQLATIMNVMTISIATALSCDQNLTLPYVFILVSGVAKIAVYGYVINEECGGRKRQLCTSERVSSISST